MIYDKTKRGKQLAAEYEKELEALVGTFFEECRGQKPLEIHKIYNDSAFQWRKFCSSINKLRNWPVRMEGDEFEKVITKSYVRTFFRESSPGRASILRTIRIIEGLTILAFTVRLIKLTVIKFFQGK